MKTLILTLALLISLNISAQEDLKYASLNILSNSIIGGIGSGIHKNSNQTFWQAFKQGAFKGSISGALNYTSKKLLQIQANNQDLDWKLCWSSKIVNSISNTVLYNASMNNNSWLDHYSINIGFLRLSTDYKVQIDPLTFNKDYNIQIDPISLSGFIYSFIIGGKFNIKTSITTGIPTFNYDFNNEVSYEFDGENLIPINTNVHEGLSIGQNIIISKKSNSFTTFYNSNITHELIHTYQRLQYSNINNSFKIYNKYENFKWIHNDLSIYDLLYVIQPYKYNIFEKEANF